MAATEAFSGAGRAPYAIFDRTDTPAWEGYGTPKPRPYKP